MRDEASSDSQEEASRVAALERHPAHSLHPRARGYGIGGGYERPYRKSTGAARDVSGSYGPLPHSGYYGAGSGSERFERGAAGFKEELSWYGPQYGETTSGLDAGAKRPR